MPLPDPTPRIWQAPVSAGVGLRFGYRCRVPFPSWPADWWQRNYDLFFEPNAADPLPLTARQKRVPGFPYPEDQP